MVTTLAILGLVMVAGISRHLEPSPLYPPFAMAACWAVFLGFHACSRGLLFPIHEETLAFFALGAAAFCGAGFVVHFFFRPGAAAAPYHPARVRTILSFFLLILALALPFYVRFINQLVADADSGSFWIDLRDRLIAEHTDTLGSFSLMDNMVVLANLTVLVAWYHRKTERWRAGAAFVFFLVYNVLTAGRAGLVITLVSLFTIEVLRQRRIPWRPLLALGLVFVIVFCGLAILVNKAGATVDDSLVENLPALVAGFQLYAIGGLVAFDTMYQHPGMIAPTQNIDRNFRIMAKKMGVRTEIPYLHAQFVTVGPSGINTNVYTIYFSYFPQLGAAGSVAMMALVGALVTWAYLRAASGEAQAVILFSLLFYGIPLSGFSENYFNGLNFMAKMLVVTFFCYRFRPPHPDPAAAC